MQSHNTKLTWQVINCAGTKCIIKEENIQIFDKNLKENLALKFNCDTDLTDANKLDTLVNSVVYFRKKQTKKTC